jgi:hypothetical protein
LGAVGDDGDPLLRSWAISESWLSKSGQRYMSLEAIGTVLRRDEQRAVIEHEAA